MNTQRLIVVQEAFKELAKILRWKILAHGKHSIREVDLILGLEGLTNVVRLGRHSLGSLFVHGSESPKHPLLLVFCVLWVSHCARTFRCPLYPTFYYSGSSYPVHNHYLPISAKDKFDSRFCGSIHLAIVFAANNDNANGDPRLS